MKKAWISLLLIFLAGPAICVDQKKIIAGPEGRLQYFPKFSSMSIGDLGTGNIIYYNGVLQGGASWFLFTGAGCSVSVVGGSATINCAGGGGGGGGGGGMFFQPGKGAPVSVSTLVFPTTDFSFFDGGSEGSTVTVKGSSGPWSASQTFLSSSTFLFTIFPSSPGGDNYSFLLASTGGPKPVYDMRVSSFQVNVTTIILGGQGFASLIIGSTQTSNPASVSGIHTYILRAGNINRGPLTTNSNYTGSSNVNWYFNDSDNPSRWVYENNIASLEWMLTTGFVGMGSGDNTGVRILQNDGAAITIDTSKNTSFQGLVTAKTGGIEISSGLARSSFTAWGGFTTTATVTAATVSVTNLLNVTSATGVNYLQYFDGKVSTSANVNWNTGIDNIPAGFADGTDDGAGGGGSDNLGSHVATGTIAMGQFAVADSSEVQIGSVFLTVNMSTQDAAILARVTKADFNIANTTGPANIGKALTALTTSQAEFKSQFTAAFSSITDLGTSTQALRTALSLYSSSADLKDAGQFTAAFTSITALGTSTQALRTALSLYTSSADIQNAGQFSAAFSSIAALQVSTNAIKDAFNTFASSASRALLVLTTRTLTATDEGGVSGAALTQLNFVGAGVAYTEGGSTGTVTISGGAGPVPSMSNASTSSLDMSNFNIVDLNSLETSSGIAKSSFTAYGGFTSTTGINALSSTFTLVDTGSASVRQVLRVSSITGVNYMAWQSGGEGIVYSTTPDVQWGSGILGMPAAFADGTDDGAGGSASMSNASTSSLDMSNFNLVDVNAINVSSGVVLSSFNVQGVITSTTGALIAGTTIQGNLLVMPGVIVATGTGKSTLSVGSVTYVTPPDLIPRFQDGVPDLQILASSVSNAAISTFTVSFPTGTYIKIHFVSSPAAAGMGGDMLFTFNNPAQLPRDALYNLSITTASRLGNAQKGIATSSNGAVGITAFGKDIYTTTATQRTIKIEVWDNGPGWLKQGQWDAISTSSSTQNAGGAPINSNTSPMRADGTFEYLNTGAFGINSVSVWTIPQTTNTVASHAYSGANTFKAGSRLTIMGTRY